MIRTHCENPNCSVAFVSPELQPPSSSLKIVFQQPANLVVNPLRRRTHKSWTRLWSFDDNKTMKTWFYCSVQSVFVVVLVGLLAVAVHAKPSLPVLIEKKLKSGDFPRVDGTADSAPTLKELISELGNLKKKDTAISVVGKVASNKAIDLSVRQDAIYFIAPFAHASYPQRVLRSLVEDGSESFEIREAAVRSLESSTLKKEAKAKLFSSFQKIKDPEGKILLRVSKYCSELGQKAVARKILEKLLERSDLEASLKTDAEEFLKFMN